MNNTKTPTAVRITMVVFPDGRFAYVTNTAKAVQNIAEVWSENITDNDVLVFQKHKLCVTEVSFSVMSDIADNIPLNQIQYPWTWAKKQ